MGGEGALKTSHSKLILSLLISRVKLSIRTLSLSPPFPFLLPKMVSMRGRKLRKLLGHHAVLLCQPPEGEASPQGLHSPGYLGA